MKKLIILSLSLLAFGCNQETEYNQKQARKTIDFPKSMVLLQTTSENDSEPNFRASATAYYNLAYVQVLTSDCAGTLQKLAIRDTTVSNPQAFVTTHTFYEGSTVATANDVVIQRLKPNILWNKKGINRRTVSVKRNGKYYALKINRGLSSDDDKVVTLIYKVSSTGVYTPFRCVYFHQNASILNWLGFKMSIYDDPIPINCN